MNSIPQRRLASFLVWRFTNQNRFRQSIFHRVCYSASAYKQQSTHVISLTSTVVNLAHATRHPFSNIPLETSLQVFRQTVSSTFCPHYQFTWDYTHSHDFRAVPNTHYQNTIFTFRTNWNVLGIFKKTEIGSRQGTGLDNEHVHAYLHFRNPYPYSKFNH